MRLNHLDLHVPDVAATRDFFVKYFGFLPVETRGVSGLAILNDISGMELVLSHPIAKFGGADTPSVGANTYHIGFIQEDKRQVDDLYRALLDGGAELLQEPREMRGSWLFYCFAPGQILIEVGWRPTKP